MFASLPTRAGPFMEWEWSQIEPYYRELIDRPLNANTLTIWLADWSHLGSLVYETYQRLYVNITIDTTDQIAEQQYQNFLDNIYPNTQSADQRLKEKLLQSGLEPVGFEVPLRNIRAEAEIYSEKNLPLLSQELKLSALYDKIIGAQTITWDGQELTLLQLQRVYQETDRERRESAWRKAAERQLADRQAINDLWEQFIEVRSQMPANANLPDYRAYRWKKLLRFDYSIEDCTRFHQAIEQAAVPAAQRIYERRRKRLGLDSVRPWDLSVDPFGMPPLRPYDKVEELDSKVAAIFHRMDPQLGEYYEIMQREGLLDLDNRKGKAPGGYCTDFPVVRRPFIFMNAVGVQDDVQTLLHEGGHAFHVFETAELPYLHQLQVGLEFAEVASTSMELFAAPYLTLDQGGFYSPKDAARAQIEFLESIVIFWPYMAVVDIFQHWVYENPQAASNPRNCDLQWSKLWARFMLGVDWSGLDEEMETGWQRKLHIHEDPFYYIEYGIAQLGALQIWQRALKDQATAVADYRKALSLGGTVPLPQLYAIAGAKFSFDIDIVSRILDLVESQIVALEQICS